MARRPRMDGVDVWHHVMNRGIAKRTVFERPQDYRKFLACVAKQVHRGRIEVHAFSLMGTHFHMLLRSVTGELSEAMRCIQNKYVRWFNRSRKRDGSLFRGRFLSRNIDSLVYRREVLRYINDNPIVAGLVADAADHEWSSAAHLDRDNRPKWLSSDWLDDELERRGGDGETFRERLQIAFPTRVNPFYREFVERQLSRRLPEELQDVSLRYAGSADTLRWMMDKTYLADNSKPWRPVAMSETVDRVLKKAMKKIGAMLGFFRRSRRSAWTALRAGLLRKLAGCTHREIGMRSHRHTSTAFRDVKDHVELSKSSRDYAAIAATLGNRVLKQMR